MAGNPVRPQHLSNLLQHVAVVVHAGLVDTQGHRDAALQHGVDRCRAALQAQIGAAVVADAGLPLGDQVEIVRRRPYPVPEGHPPVQQPHAVQVPERRAAGALSCICALIGRLQQVHVDGRIKLVGQGGHPLQGPVRTPLEVQGGQLDRHIAGVRELVAQDSKHLEILLGRQRKGIDRCPQRHGEVAGQARIELLVILVDDAVLITQAVGVGHPHPHIPVGPDHLPGAGRNLAGAARHSAVEMLDGGHTGADELERRVKRIQIDVDLARPHAVVDPELQRQVRRTELQRCQAHVMVCVDESGDDNEVVAPNHVRCAVLGREIGRRTNLRDDAVPYQQSPVVDLLHVSVRVDAADRLPPDLDCIHCSPLLARTPGDGRIARRIHGNRAPQVRTESLVRLDAMDGDAAGMQEGQRIRLRYAWCNAGSGALE